MTARFSILLKLHASPDSLPFGLYNNKRLEIQHMERPLFPTTLDSVLWHREVSRAKDLSAPLDIHEVRCRLQNIYREILSRNLKFMHVMTDWVLYTSVIVLHTVVGNGYVLLCWSSNTEVLPRHPAIRPSRKICSNTPAQRSSRLSGGGPTTSESEHWTSLWAGWWIVSSACRNITGDLRFV
jgi:hypothetical protein